MTEETIVSLDELCVGRISLRPDIPDSSRPEPLWSSLRTRKSSFDIWLTESLCFQEDMDDVKKTQLC